METLHYMKLHIGAVANGDVIKLLLDRGANKNMENQEGLTPLHAAACEGHNHVVILL